VFFLHNILLGIYWEQNAKSLKKPLSVYILYFLLGLKIVVTTFKSVTFNNKTVFFSLNSSKAVKIIGLSPQTSINPLK
jgi:hypothetical protein